MGLLDVLRSSIDRLLDKPVPAPASEDVAPQVALDLDLDRLVCNGMPLRQQHDAFDAPWSRPVYVDKRSRQAFCPAQGLVYLWDRQGQVDSLNLVFAPNAGKDAFGRWASHFRPCKVRLLRAGRPPLALSAQLDTQAIIESLGPPEEQSASDEGSSLEYTLDCPRAGTKIGLSFECGTSGRLQYLWMDF